MISRSMSSCVKNVEIRASIAPDHKSVFLNIEVKNEFMRGPGLWKFNNRSSQFTPLVKSRRVVYVITTFCIYKAYFSCYFFGAWSSFLCSHATRSLVQCSTVPSQLNAVEYRLM